MFKWGSEALLFTETPGEKVLPGFDCIFWLCKKNWLSKMGTFTHLVEGSTGVNVNSLAIVR